MRRPSFNAAAAIGLGLALLIGIVLIAVVATFFPLS